MGVFEDILVKAKGAVDALGERAGQFVDVSKLNIKTAELKSDLKSEYEALGKTVYNCEKNHIDSASEIANAVVRIDSIYMQIEELKKQVAKMKNKVFCKECGSANDLGDSFCGKCGKELRDSFNKPLEEADDFSEFEK